MIPQTEVFFFSGIEVVKKRRGSSKTLPLQVSNPCMLEIVTLIMWSRWSCEGDIMKRTGVWHAVGYLGSVPEPMCTREWFPFSRPWKGSSFGCNATVNARSAERRYLKWISKFTSLQFFRKTMQWCHITCAKGCAFVRGDLWICLNFHCFSDLLCVVCRVSCGCMSCGPAILFSSFVLVTSMLFAIAPGMSLLSTFAGQHTPNNSSIMPGMGLNRDKNSYLYPEYQVLFCAMPPVYVVCLHSVACASSSAGLARPRWTTSKCTGRVVGFWMNTRMSEVPVSCQSLLWQNFERIST